MPNMNGVETLNKLKELDNFNTKVIALTADTIEGMIVQDADRLDADLLSVAQTIRTKGGTSEPLAWPDGYMSAVEAIQTGGAAPVIEPLEVTENGTYEAPDGVDGYSPVTVNVAGSGESGGSEYEDLLVTRKIQEYTNSRVDIIASYAFYRYSLLTSVDFPKVKYIGSYAFLSCSKLAFVSFPETSYIATSAFQSCVSLASVSFPNVTGVGNGAFSECSRLVSVSLPAVLSFGGSIFYRCSKIMSVSFPMLSNIGSCTFCSCVNLIDVNCPKVTDIHREAFGYCSSLTSVSFPSASFIGASAFVRCAALGTVYLMGDSVCTLSNSNAFSGTLITSSTGSIFVRASLLASYQISTNWAYFSTQIFAGD